MNALAERRLRNMNDLSVTEILANGTPNLYFDARVSTADEIVSYLRGLVDQPFLIAWCERNGGV
jgi:hypothetical protein